MLKLITVALVAMTTTASAAEICHYSEFPAEVVNIMGTIVVKQPDVIIAAECGKTYEEVHNAYLAQPKATAVFEVKPRATIAHVNR